MNSNRLLTIFVIVIIVLTMIISCVVMYNDELVQTNIKQETTIEPPKRIQRVEYTVVNGIGIIIFKIDSIEFVTTSSGGITPLIRPCGSIR